MNPNDTVSISRLRTAMERSRNKLKPFREKRLDAIKQYVGRHYGEDGTGDTVPLPMLELAVSVFTQQLVGGRPRAFTSTKHPELIPTCVDLKLALDHVIDEIDLQDTLWRVTQDALFGIGIIQTGICEQDGSGGWWHDLWQPYADHVDLDDWVQDMAVKRWEQLAFCGNRWRAPFDLIRDSDLYDPKERAKLKPTPKEGTNEEGDERVETLAGGQDGDPDEYQDYIELWNIWLPRERLVLTLPAEPVESKPLRIVEWDGPEGGPYTILQFNPVPGNLMPLPPVAIWKDLHDLANRVFRKLGRQAERQKSILPVSQADEEDIKALRDANDGEVIGIHGQVPKEARFGGPDQVNLAFLLAMNDMFNRHAGNLDTLGGLSPQADTLGQEEMLGANASQRIVYMRQVVDAFAGKILSKLAFYLFDDPFVQIPLEKPVGNTGFTIPTVWNAEKGEADYQQFNIEIEKYSMKYKSPTTQLRSIMELLTTVILPLAPMMESQGIGINFEALLKVLAKYGEIDELKEFLIFTQPPSTYERGPVGEPTRQAPVTTRRYERTNRPGATRAGKENALIQTLLGSMPQPHEAAQIGRGVG